MTRRLQRIQRFIHRKKRMTYNIIGIVAVLLGSLGFIGHHTKIAYTPSTNDIKSSHSSTAANEINNIENSSTPTATANTKVQQVEQSTNYPLHTNIITTIFWV